MREVLGKKLVELVKENTIEIKWIFQHDESIEIEDVESLKSEKK